MKTQAISPIPDPLAGRQAHGRAGMAALLFLGAVAFCAPALVLAQPKVVPTLVVRAAPTDGRFVLDGVVQAVQQSTVSAQANGRISRLLVKAGDQVRSGQLLATIDDREVAVDQQKSQAQTLQAEADLRNARAQFERTQDLQSKGFVSKAALDVADAQLKSAQAQRDQASAATSLSALSRSYTRVTAPFDGWILQTQAESGDLAVPGKPLLTLYAPLPLRVVVQVPASRAQWARDAADVQVQTDRVRPGDAQPEPITPTARTLVPSSDPVAQTTEWRLELPPAKSAALVPGQQVRVRFTLSRATQDHALAVPDTAIVRRGELTAVYVVSGKTFALRAVRLGAPGPQGVEVLAGLRDGDRVALDPMAAAQAGATAAAAAPSTP